MYPPGTCLFGVKYNGDCWIDNLVAAEVLVTIDQILQQLTLLANVTRFVSQPVTVPYPLPDRVVKTNGKPLLFQQPIATFAKVEGFSTPGQKRKKTAILFTENCTSQIILLC
jgi:hypothetical protein